MTLADVMKQLEGYGDAQTKKTHLTHGAKEPFFGVKVGDLKKILKKTKKNHELSLELYNTGNSDAMYLAGLMADENKITKEQLQEWVQKANWAFLTEYAVPWVAAETPFGFELGMEWIESDSENIASSGWATLSYFAAVNEDANLDMDKYTQLLERVEKEIHSAQNRVKYTMNGFVIAVGNYVPALTSKAQKVAENIGKVDVFMAGTACKVPLAKEYIQKCVDKKSVGKKRKTARC